MGLIDKIASQYMDDPEFARAFKQSYQEGIHSHWGLVLITSQNNGATGVVVPEAYIAGANNSSPGLKEAVSAA